MKREIVTKLHNSFEGCAHRQDDIEYWNAREMQVLLGYSEWRNFLLVIDKAKITFLNAGQSVEDHFVDVNKMIDLGKGASREIYDLALTRYACFANCTC